MNKRLLLTICISCLLIILVGCNSQDKTADTYGTESHPVRIAVTPGPHAIVFDEVKKRAEKDGFHIQVVEFSDYVTPNVALLNGEVEMTSHQHQPYLDNFNAGQGNALTSIGTTILLPMAIFSSHHHDLANLPDQARVSIPNDPTNGGRALLVLQAAGLITLRDGGTVTSSIADITENPKHLQILELEAAQIPRSLQDMDIAVVNTNYAVAAGMNPVRDALFVEPKDSPYANILAVRFADKDNPAFQKVRAYYQQKEIADFINRTFEGSILPAF